MARKREAKDIDGVAHYQCSACKHFFPYGSFYRDDRNKDGIKATCKKCHSARVMADYEQKKSIKAPRNATPNAIARRNALIAGNKHYFTGIPCRNGHIAEYLTESGTCMECRKIHMRAFRERKKSGKPKVERKRVVERDDISLPDGVIPGARVFLMGRQVL